MSATASYPLPTPTELSKPYWEALAAGHLAFQRCEGCANAWLPARADCPKCLSPKWRWERAGGGGSVVSWVVYHQCYHEAFRARIPYNVTVVELDEGPRLLTNVIGIPGGAGLSVGARVTLAIEQEQGVALARFRLAR